VAVEPPTPFVTAQQLSDYTNGKVASTHPALVDMLAGASAGLRRYCGWHIGPTRREELVVDGSGGRLLLLPTLHVTQVHLVTEHGREPMLGDEVEWSAIGTLRAPTRWTERFRGVTVDLDHGYPLAEIPDVAQIVKQVVATALASPMGVTREQAGQISVSWATTAPNVAGGLSLLDRDLALLEAYRLGGRA